MKNIFMRSFCLLTLMTLLLAPSPAGAEVDSAWVGSWTASSPDPKKPGLNWNFIFTVAADGGYTLVTAAGDTRLPNVDGAFTAEDGKWTTTPTTGKPAQGTYRIADGKMELTYSNGKVLTWKRVDLAPKRSAADGGKPKRGPGFEDFAKGVDAMEAGDGKEAIGSLSKAVAADDKNWLYHSALGLCQLSAENLKAAVPELQRSDELRPDPLNRNFFWLANELADLRPDSIGSPQNDYETLINHTGMAYFGAHRAKKSGPPLNANAAILAANAGHKDAASSAAEARQLMAEFRRQTAQMLKRAAGISVAAAAAPRRAGPVDKDLVGNWTGGTVNGAYQCLLQVRPDGHYTWLFKSAGGERKETGTISTVEHDTYGDFATHPDNSEPSDKGQYQIEDNVGGTRLSMNGARIKASFKPARN